MGRFTIRVRGMKITFLFDNDDLQHLCLKTIPPSDWTYEARPTAAKKLLESDNNCPSYGKMCHLEQNSLSHFNFRIGSASV